MRALSLLAFCCLSLFMSLSVWCCRRNRDEQLRTTINQKLIETGERDRFAVAKDFDDIIYYPFVVQNLCNCVAECLKYILFVYVLLGNLLLR